MIIFTYSICNKDINPSSNINELKMYMDIFLTIVASLFMILGIIGSFLPILPGPITSWLGLFIILITLAIAIFIWLLDYIIPAIGTKRFGGTRYGMIGTTIGLIIGLLAPIPGGIIIGPFFGALAGELLNNSDTNTATKAAFGSFIGFLTSTFIKFVVAVIYLGLFIKIII